MAGKFLRLLQCFCPSDKVFVALFLFLLRLVTVVQAQQPASELGTWPAGAITLFVGSLARKPGRHHRCFRFRLDYMPKATCPGDSGPEIPPVGRATLGNGGQFACVFRLCDTAGVPQASKTVTGDGVWEWDVLSIYHTATPRSPKFEEVKPDGENDATEREPVMTVRTPPSNNIDIHLGFRIKKSRKNLDEVHNTLLEDLDNPTADKLLQYWHGLQSYLTTKTVDHMLPTDKDNGTIFDHNSISLAVQYYSNRKLSEWDAGKEKLTVFVAASPTEENETGHIASMLYDALSMKHLVAMLIYVQQFPGPLQVNPLVQLLWWWSQGKLRCSDNMFFTLPPAEIQQLQRPSKSPNTLADVPTPTCCKIPLSVGLCCVDGGGSHKPRISWIWIINFFASLTGTSNPSLATSVGLLLLRPANNDNNWRDFGQPPSWNGRRRIRWSDGDNVYACEIFSGSTQVRIGNIGSSVYRCIGLMMVSWFAWGWRDELQPRFSI